MYTRDTGKSHLNVTVQPAFNLAPLKGTGTMENASLHRQTKPYLVKKGGAVHGRLFGDWWAAAKGLGDHPIVVGHPQSTLVHVHLLFQQSTCGTDTARGTAEAGPDRSVGPSL